MKSNQMLRPLAAILLFTVLVAADSEKHLLVKSKCNCLTMTSKTVVNVLPSGARVEQLIRDIKITIPMRSRENISDPTSPLRTKFVYKISDFCKNCTQKPTSPEEPQCKAPSPSPDTCFSHDNRKCLYRKINLGDDKHMNAVMNPECLKHEPNHWIPKTRRSI
ncbi:immunoglobulin J chain-like [Narcine bancroftii]|uniref:immunoglobulin J chain-like n=1 Tax=Narcine bancroftii TaxID=1343680 RepID=UPI0038319B53